MWSPYLDRGLWTAEPHGGAVGVWFMTADNKENQQLPIREWLSRMENPIMLFLAYLLALIFTCKDDEYERSTFWRVRCFLAKVTWRLSLLGMLLWTLQCDPEEYDALAYYVLILTLPSSIWAYWIILQRGIHHNILLFISWYRLFRMLALRNRRKDETDEKININNMSVSDILNGTNYSLLMPDKSASETYYNSSGKHDSDKLEGLIPKRQLTDIKQDDDRHTDTERLSLTDDKNNINVTDITNNNITRSPSLNSMKEDVVVKL